MLEGSFCLLEFLIFVDALHFLPSSFFAYLCNLCAYFIFAEFAIPILSLSLFTTLGMSSDSSSDIGCDRLRSLLERDITPMSLSILLLLTRRFPWQNPSLSPFLWCLPGSKLWLSRKRRSRWLKVKRAYRIVGILGFKTRWSSMLSSLLLRRG